MIDTHRPLPAESDHRASTTSTVASRSARRARRSATTTAPPIAASPDAGSTAPPARPWTINGDFFGLRPTGVARYAREVTLALDDLVGEDHPLTRGLKLEIVAPRSPEDGFALKSIPVRIVPEFAYPRLPQFWVQMQLPFQVRGGLLSFCNLAPVAVGKHIACIHDLHTRLMPHSYGRFFRLAHRIILPALGRRASALTTVSDLSRDHLVAYGIAPRDKITVGYNGSDHVARWDPDRSLLELEGTRPYVFCLGQRQNYKNVALLLKLAPMLGQRGIDVVMAGDVDEAFLAQHAPQLPDNLRLLGRVSDDDLAKALTGALCFLFPSRIEGFGIPAVEAMALGCPLVASSAPCLPEICGDAALYADPDDIDAWVAAVHRIGSDGALRRRLIADGHARAARYTWRNVAEIYLHLMAESDSIRH